MDYQNENTTLNTSRFSWRRVMDVASFYRPGVEKQVLWYLIASVICAMLTLLPLGQFAQLGLYTIIWTALPLLFEMAPCMLTKQGDSRIIERLITATPAEKYTFRLIYFLVVIPIACQLFPRLALYLYTQIPSIQTEETLSLIKVSLGSPALIYAINTLTAVGASMTCLYVVTRARTNRALKGILSVFAVQIGAGLLGAFWGFSAALKLGIDDGMANYQRDTAEITERLMENMISSPYMIFAICVLSAYLLLMLVLNYRILYKRNL